MTMEPAVQVGVSQRTDPLGATSLAPGLRWFQPSRDHVEVEVWRALMTALRDVSLPRLLYVTFMKRLLDITAAVLFMAVLAPLFIAVVLLVRLDSPGKAIFRQPRVGRGGREFMLYKFRSMQDNPTGNIDWVVDENGRKCHKLRKDPRVTRMGRWLRRTSIDELPQLVNVIKGDMSLIGPRPELPEIARHYEPWQHDRHLVRPGLTGWWQVSGRSDLPMHENTELDLFYVRRQSFRIDVLIALRTIRVVFKGLGAF